MDQEAHSSRTVTDAASDEDLLERLRHNLELTPADRLARFAARIRAQHDAANPTPSAGDASS
jgi:hypothetical protein